MRSAAPSPTSRRTIRQRGEIIGFRGTLPLVPLSQEDLTRITEILHATEGRLDAKIDRLDAKIDGLDAKIDSTEQRLNARIEHVETGLLTMMAENLQAVEDRLNAKIEHVETSLLTAFHKWASPLELRVRSHSAAIRAMDLEQEFHADRNSKLEGKRPEA